MFQTNLFPHKYKSETSKPAIDINAIVAAIKEVTIEKKSLRSVGQAYKIDKSKLSRYISKLTQAIFDPSIASNEQSVNSVSSLSGQTGRKTIFSAQQEAIYYGLSISEGQRNLLRIEHKIPEQISGNRAKSFSATIVSACLANLATVIDEIVFEPHRIWNIDETGCPTVPIKGYNIHINGVFHCSVRYKQLHNLHEQLKKEFGNETVPVFPPKKLLPLSAGQLEERRLLLEKYIQTLGQDTKLVSSEIFVCFLLSAQQETACEKKQERTLDVYTMNNCQIQLKVFSTDRTYQVLIKTCKQLNLPLQYVHYFSLFFVKREDNGDVTIIRKLQDFEAPYISCKTYNNASYRIVIRKSYWDPEYDSEIMKNPVALNLLYIQTVFEVEKGWIICPKDVKTELAQLQACLAKRNYIELACTLKYYGFIQFNPCYCDYPEPQTKVLLSVGGQELSLRIIGPGPFVKEGCFKVTRMRCWRITATHNKQNIAANSKCSGKPDLELSFEYLMSKDKLQWITITSDQAILMSVCLQSMVDELLMKRNGNIRKEYALKGNLSYMKRDGSSHTVSLDNPDVNSTIKCSSQSPKSQESFSIKKLQEKFSTVSFKNGREFVENHAFEGIGDDDL